jgi:hypothetical protein
VARRGRNIGVFFFNRGSVAVKKSRVYLALAGMKKGCEQCDQCESASFNGIH